MGYIVASHFCPNCTHHRATISPNRPGTPSDGGPANVVLVRLDSSLRAAVEARATTDHTTTSDVIREALRRYLEVA
jgi:Ribbon-helix-helix protein, copG family